MEIQSIKQRFGIIGSSTILDRAIDIACQVAPTDLTVLITGESGTGKEVFPKLIHSLSSRKHGNFIAVNCGAIPEGTIDSELFGHEKGSFTGATEGRKGYFEVADGGTIFMDEVAELPLSTQVRLLRVLETGEFIRVGSSKPQKTNVRLVAATNVNLPEAINNGRFREDLYYRLNTVPIIVPPLRNRKDDIFLLFRKFASDFAQKYRMPVIQLTQDAQNLLIDYNWNGNVRQLKNVTEQISIIEKDRLIHSEVLRKYLPEAYQSKLPVLLKDQSSNSLNERDLLYKILFDMKRDINDLKQLVNVMLQDEYMGDVLKNSNSRLIKEIKSEFKGDAFNEYFQTDTKFDTNKPEIIYPENQFNEPIQEFSLPISDSEVIEESLSLQDKEVDLIRKALKKYNNRRKAAALELGISERTLYRKIKEYDIE